MAMSDTEALDLISHYGWAVIPQVGGGWVVEGAGMVGLDDADVVELARTREPLREAIRLAMRRQAGVE